MSYRDLPDPGLLIGQAINALARGFAAAVEGAAAAPKQASQFAPFVDVDMMPASVLANLLRGLLRDKKVSSLSTWRDARDRSVTISATIDGQRFREHIDEHALCLADNPMRLYLEAVERIARRAA